MRQVKLFTAVFLAVKKYLSKTLDKRDKEVSSKFDEHYNLIQGMDNKIKEDGKEIAIELAKSTRKALDKGFEEISSEVDLRIRRDIPITVDEEIDARLPKRVDSAVASKLSDIDWQEFYGVNGDDGLSAYEVWLENNEGSVEDFFQYLKGDTGVGLEYIVTNDRIGFKREDQEAYTYTDSLTGQKGASVEWTIEGDKVGFRTEGESAFTFTPNLTGQKGDKGEDGLDGDDGKDGVSLDFIIAGNKVGVKKSNQDEYEYTDNLTGKKGKDGVDGESLDFTIKGDKIGVKRSSESRYTYTPSLKGQDGKDGKDGEDGEKGDIPDHRWVAGTMLQFEKPNGEWGKAVDLRGASGGGGGRGGSRFDPETLPLIGEDEDTDIQELLVKSNGQWKRITLERFKELTGKVVVKSGEDTVKSGDDIVIL